MRDIQYKYALRMLDYYNNCDALEGALEHYVEVNDDIKSIGSAYISLNHYYNGNDVFVHGVSASDDDFLLISCYGDIKLISRENLYTFYSFKDDSECDLFLIHEVLKDNRIISYIDEDEFRNRNMKWIIIPNTVGVIYRNGYRNNNLTSILIPYSVFCIEGGAFYGNPNLDVVYVPQRTKYKYVIGGEFNHAFDKHVEIIEY